MQIRGIGTDIVKIERIRNAIKKHPNFKPRIFTDGEIVYCESKKMPELHYAMRFAAKEAVSKAMGTGFRAFAFIDIEVQRNEKGKPAPTLLGNALEVAGQCGIKSFELSLSYDHEYAIAFAVAIG